MTFSFLDQMLSDLQKSGLGARGYVGPTYRGPSRDRALPGKKRIRARKAANRSSAILTVEQPAPKVAKYGLRELEAYPVARLHTLATELGMKGHSKITRKGDLVEFMYQHEKNQR